MYEALIETRIFYLKGEPILTDIIACSEPIFKESVNKALYHISHNTKGTFSADRFRYGNYFPYNENFR